VVRILEKLERMPGFFKQICFHFQENWAGFQNFGKRNFHLWFSHISYQLGLEGGFHKLVISSSIFFNYKNDQKS
jgi:hypothetical protein